MSRLTLVLIAVLLLTNVPADLSTSRTTTPHHESEKTYSQGLHRISDSLGELIFAEDFQIAPLGFNDSNWNLITINSPSLAWVNENSLDLWGERFKSTVLKSSQLFGPSITADINVSFTLGSCYFCIGWCDDWRDDEHDWIANGRECENGVFIDCWDGELFLVTYADGERTASLIETGDLVGWHNIRIEWTESLIQLDIDGENVDYISKTIPQTQVAFAFMISGHHSHVEPGRLSIDSLKIFEYSRSPSQSDPEITLLWPTNNSIVHACSLIDFEVRGAKSNLTCSWERRYPFDVSAPWDVPVPFIIYSPSLTLPISLHLTVSAIDAEGNQSSASFTFRVDDPEENLGVWFMPNKPIIDGFIDTDEKDSASNIEAAFRSECEHEVNTNILAGYTSDSLYIAVESPISDSYHSRATLFLDGNADLMWSNLPPDISVTVASPSADASYTSVSGANEELVTSITFDTLVHDGVVTYEFLIPTTELNIDGEEGIALGIRLSNGGYSLDFPDREGLVIVQSLGVSASIPEAVRLASVIGIAIFGVALVGLAIFAARRESYYVDNGGNDEKLERIKTLLLSYDRIEFPRLSRMMNLEEDTVRAMVADLIAQGFPVYNANGELVRYHKTIKPNKGNSM